MASEDRREWYFVDAICINQSDMAERASQVTLMGHIYRNAKEVIAWIYLDDGDESWAITKGTRQVEIEQALRHFQQLEQDRRIAGQELTYEEPKSLTELVKMAKALILFSSYWSRLWIVQEILLARVLTIRWLSHTFDWLDIVFSDAVSPGVPLGDLLPRERPLQPQPLSTTRVAGHFEWASFAGNVENAIMCKQLCHWQKSTGSDLQNGKLLDFHDAVIFFARQNCSQVSDSIFGLMGIASSYIRPDYDTSAVELYTASLYNTLLSLWRRRPPELAKSAEEPSDFEMLEALGLPVSKLKSVGEALVHLFRLEPFQKVTFLISYEVCRRFMPGRQLLGQQYLAYSWLLLTSYTKLKFNREARPGALRPEGKVDRLMTKKWYETEDQALQRFYRDLRRRSARTLAQVEAKKKGDRNMTGPAPSLQTMPCTAWIALIQTICDNIWAQASADVASQAV